MSLVPVNDGLRGIAPLTPMTSHPPSTAHTAWGTWFHENGSKLLLFARQMTRSSADAEDVLRYIRPVSVVGGVIEAPQEAAPAPVPAPVPIVAPPPVAEPEPPRIPNAAIAGTASRIGDLLARRRQN